MLHLREEQQYLDILKEILEEGNSEEFSAKDTRTGVPARRVFHREMRFNLRDGHVPFLTTKKVPVKSTIAEFLWVMRGQRKLSDLLKMGCTFWTPWPFKNFELIYKQMAGKDQSTNLAEFEDLILQRNLDSLKEKYGDSLTMLLRIADSLDDMGPLYGFQWRNWTTYEFLTKIDHSEIFRPHSKGIDQLQAVLTSLRSDPYGRQSTVLTSWNVAELQEMTLPPCHACHINHFVDNGRLNVKMVQRSADMPIGVPVNIAFYSIYVHVMAKLAGLEPGTLIWSGDNCHVYANQFDAVHEQVYNREPLGKFPTLELPDMSELSDLDDLTPDDFNVVGYEHLPAIKIDVAV